MSQAILTQIRYNITIDHAPTTTHSSEHSSHSSRSSHSSPLGTDEEDGVQVSPRSALDSHDYSDPIDGEEGWVLPVYPDEIGPSDSASRPRTSHQHRTVVEAPHPEQVRRQTSQHRHARDRITQHRHSRAHRPPPTTSSGSVDSNEEWRGGYPRGPPQHQGRSYPHWDGHPPPGYAPSYFPSTAMVPQNQQIVPYGFSPYQTGGPTAGYFSPTPHGGPQLISHPASSPFAGNPHNPGYYPVPVPSYSVPPPAMYPPHYTPVHSPAPVATPPPSSSETSKDDDKFARLEKLLIEQKAEQEAREAAARQALEDAAAKAEADKKIAADIAAASAAAAAAATEEAEKKAAAFAEEAEKKAATATEEAEKKATDALEAEKKATAAAEEAEKKAAAATEEAAAAVAAAAKPPPPPEERKKPIKFKDAVGRKFSFPFHLCSNWDVS